jgi:hypothetical protein
LYIFGENNINASNSPTMEVRIYQHATKKGGKR